MGDRHPGEVPTTLVDRPDLLPQIGQALDGAQRVAIDTEVPISGPGRGRMRVMSMAVRRSDGSEVAFVVDARDIDTRLLAPLLDGVEADAWNADFDARIIDAAVWASTDTTSGLRWWDAQLADALLHQGRSGVTWYHGLAWATDHYLGIEAEGKGTVQLSYTATDDLSDDQIAYAAADAVETLWVADAIRAEITAAGLDEICRIEMEARPFLDQMERTGLPFDVDGWRHELEQMERQQRSVVGRLATLTGGGQGTLFDDVTEPSWNPASDRQVREALNRWATAEVHRYTTASGGAARDLTEQDRVTADVLREIGGDLAATLLEFRSLAKVLGTYGESILDDVDDDGRMRPQYLQVVGTNTGRLASRNPNAQNFTPLMKPFVRPADDRRFVHADLSQAELRYLAQVAEDHALRAAFERGDDVHVTTAATMFGFDRERLATEDPDRFAHLRQIAKALNFGIAYGSGAAALARQLSVEGSPTTVEEAGDLLAQYRQTYPGTTAWAEARIAEIGKIREDTVAIDWPSTLRLANGHPAIREIRRDFRRSHGRWPTAAEVTERHPLAGAGAGNGHAGGGAGGGVQATLDLAAEVEWLLGYPAPVALVADGSPFTFASRTLSGRRQQFNLHLDRLFLETVVEAALDPSPGPAATRRRFQRETGVGSSANAPSSHTPSSKDLHHAFEDRTLRRRYVNLMVEELGAEETHRRLGRAARERVSTMVNAWRNAPIQGGVADIMLVAFADLQEQLRAHPTARPVQTVHDSIVVECDVADAEAVGHAVRFALEDASLRFCPDVRPRVDVDIRRSLASADIEREL